MRRNIIRLIGRQEGIAAVEFALSLSIMMMLFLGTIEVTRYMLIIQKLEKTVDAVTDVTTQVNPNTNPLTTSTMLQLFTAVQDMMKPYTFGASGFVIITDVTQSGASNPIVNWQYCSGAGSMAATSHIGTTIAGAATLPPGFSMIAGEEVVIGEIFYNYVPLTVQNVLSGTTIYRTAIFMPRLGALTGFNSTCP